MSESLKYAMLAVVAYVVTACASGPSISVLERADGLSRAPEWTTLSYAEKADSKDMTFLGFTEEPGDVNKSGALNVSDELAMGEPMRSLVDAFLDQSQVGQEIRSDGSVSTRVISATRGYRPPMPSLRITKRYWEVVVITTPGGDSTQKLRAYSLASISKSDFEKAKKAYLDRIKGDPEVKKILEDVGAKQREQVLSRESEK